MLCQFQVCSKVNHLHIHIYMFQIIFPYRPYRILSRVPCAIQQVLISYLFYIQQCCWLYPQANKVYSCPASRLKKIPGVSNRDISGLMDRGAYMSEAGSRSEILTCVARGRAGHSSALFSPGSGETTSYKEFDIMWALQFQGSQHRGTRLTAPLISHHQLRPRARKQEVQSCEQVVGDTGPGWARDVQKAREQPS